MVCHGVVWRIINTLRRIDSIVEHRICDQAARVDGLGYGLVCLCSERWAIAQRTVVLASQLASVKGLHISSMILIEVGEPIVKKHRRANWVWNGEFQLTYGRREGFARRRSRGSIGNSLPVRNVLFIPSPSWIAAASFLTTLFEIGRKAAGVHVRVERLTQVRFMRSINEAT